MAKALNQSFAWLISALISSSIFGGTIIFILSAKTEHDSSSAEHGSHEGETDQKNPESISTETQLEKAETHDSGHKNATAGETDNDHSVITPKGGNLVDQKNDVHKEKKTSHTEEEEVEIKAESFKKASHHTSEKKTKPH